MLSPDFVILTAIAYIGVLFALAYVSDARSQSGRVGLLRSPIVYTLSISVYCTSWTFYGAVGTAARNGLEFMAIYIGPSLVFVGWWFVLRKLIRISHAQRITSIADFLSSRFGKSNPLAVLVTLIVVVVVTPYIALQLKAVTTSIRTVSLARAVESDHLAMLDELGIAFAIAVIMAVFTILFGTRNVDAREQHLGVVAAIAFEAAVKLIALLAVGIFVVWGIGDGFADIHARAVAAGLDVHERQPFGARWVAILFLSACAAICLPRQFQITVVENADEDHLRTASWAFPTYMLLMCVFTMPIALYGLATMPAGSNPDMFVLTLPMLADRDALALLVFIGGFSSATSMIIVASIALSIMVSNHIILPVMLRYTGNAEQAAERDIARLLLRSRRISIACLLGLGFLYFRLTEDSPALAPIGLISFAGVAQFLPSMLAALYWRGANVRGACAGIGVGFVVWGWATFLPSLASFSPTVQALLADGPWGIGFLRPEALFGLDGVDPLAHAVFWSLLCNTTALVGVSLASGQGALERIQATLFVDAFRHGASWQPRTIHGSATTEQLFFVAERVLGWQPARALFDAAGMVRGTPAWHADVRPGFIARLERELAGSIGSASAHILLEKAVVGDTVSLEEVMRIADETQRAIEYSHALEIRSHELHTTAQQLKLANTLLHDLHRQKDEFLSQVSHEIRTPMTSIRSFAEILSRGEELSETQRQRFITTIHKESVRLTRLLDDILDLGTLERGERDWENVPLDAETVLDQAMMVCEGQARERGVLIESGARAHGAVILGDSGRLSQVFINLISNAIAYNDAAEPRVNVSSHVADGLYVVAIADNGPGIAPQARSVIFDKFVRAGPGAASGVRGLGLGLNIARNIVRKLDGRLELTQGHLPGACFRVVLPLTAAPAPAD